MNNVNKDLKLREQGYVYVILDNHGRVKIGKSLTPQKRIQSISSSSGIIIEDAYITDALFGYSELETLLHKAFDNHRQIGEWFDCKFGDVVTFIKASDITEFTKERYIDLSRSRALVSHLDTNLRNSVRKREEGLINPLVDIIEVMAGVRNNLDKGHTYHASPESHQRIVSAFEAKIANDNEDHSAKRDLIHKLEYLMNKCDALEKLNDCYSEQLYLDSELYSRLKDTSEIDELGKEYHDMHMELNSKSLEALQEIMKPLMPIDSEVIA